ncbi:hypothetical protein Ciccas_012796, partial [Cichlidogyrus casuarinus]
RSARGHILFRTRAVTPLITLTQFTWTATKSAISSSSLNGRSNTPSPIYGDSYLTITWSSSCSSTNLCST